MALGALGALVMGVLAELTLETPTLDALELGISPLEMLELVEGELLAGREAKFRVSLV